MNDINILKEIFDTQGDALVYSDNNVKIIHTLTDIQSSVDNLLIDGFLLLYLRSGKMSVRVNNDNFDVEAGTIVICSPRTIIDNALISIGVDVTGFLGSAAIAQQIMDLTHFSLYFKIALEDKIRILPLSPQQVKFIDNYVECIKDCFNMMQDEGNKNKVMLHLFTAVAYSLHDFFGKDYDCVDEEKTKNESAASILTKKFLNMLRQDQPYRSVDHYATQLCVSAKYLSSCCKMACDMTASQIITNHIISQTKILMRDTKLTQKEIAFRLGFANPSHFGTFIRRNTGMTPQQLRATL